VRARETVAALATLATAILFASPARADGSDTDRQIAQTLFDDGRALMEKGAYAEACPKFAESQRLDPGGGTLLNLAVCHELEGKTATAWSEFRDALAQAIRDGRKDRETLANEHIAALAPKLVRLTVAVPEGVAAREPEIMLDTSRLPRPAWGTAIPVDPGAHKVAVSAPGLPKWESEIAATEPGQSYRVEVPALDRPGPGDCPPGTSRSGEGDACVAPAATPREVRVRSVSFYILLAGAGASLATSVVTGLMALDANGYVDDNCAPERDFCRVPDAADEASRARTMAWVSTATLGVGAAAAVVAFLLPLEKRSPVSARLAPGWLGVAGSF